MFDEGTMLFTQDTILNGIARAGFELDHRFEIEKHWQSPVMFVGALNGCYPFMTDLIRAMPIGRDLIEINHVMPGKGDDPKDIYGFDLATIDMYTVVFVDDICDSGTTLERITETLSVATGDGTVYTAVLTDRPERHPYVRPTVAALTVPSYAGWLKGWGMDAYEGQGRYCDNITWTTPR